MARGLLDTSVIIAIETDRSIEYDQLPEESVISPVTVAELQAGLLSATTPESRMDRMRSIQFVAGSELVPVDERVASAWALLRTHLKESGRRVRVNDLWIAATALAHRIPVYTQDADFDVLDGVGGLQVVKL